MPSASLVLGHWGSPALCRGSSLRSVAFVVPQPVPKGLEKPKSPFPDLCLLAAVEEQFISWKIIADFL